MIVRIITARVKPGREQEFEAATTENHTGSIAEPGVVRFDVLRDDDNPGTYYLYEVYRDDAATRAHKETEHYERWRTAVADLMDGARTSVACSVIAPADPDQW